MTTGRRLLVTGGCGFIGSNFIRWLRRERPAWHVVNLDALTYSGNRANLADIERDANYEFHHGDINDEPLVARLVAGVDTIVHFAAETHVDRSITNARPFVSTNVLGTQVLLDAARQRTGVRFVHVSTDEVYGSLPLDRPDLSFDEATAIAPRSPYSASKAGSDLLVMSYHHTFGLDAIVARCSNNFGPYQYPEKVIPRFVTNLVDGRRLPLFGDGRNVRDWIHVDDHCEALLMIAERGRSGEIYNIGAGNEHSNLELAHTILAIMGMPDSYVEFVPDRRGHDRRYAIDSGKMHAEFGWSPSRSGWPDALDRTVTWYRENEAWWRRLVESRDP